MSRQFLVSGVLALVVVAAVVGGILVSTRKNRVELTGEVLKVRSHQMDAEHTVVLIDLRVHNPSTQQFVIREVQAFVEEPDGKSTAADVFAESDIRRVVQYYPVLGELYNPGLLRKDKVNAGSTVDRTVSISAPLTDERLAARKRLRLVIHDIDGPSVEISEHR